MCTYHHLDRHGPGGREAAPESGDLRVSTAERDAVVDALRQHTAEGRLTLDEFAERVEAALGATTRDDLGKPLDALPTLTTRRDRHGEPPGRARFLRIVRGALIAALVVTAIAFGHPWVVFPLAWLLFARAYRPWRGRPGRGRRSAIRSR